MIRACLAALYIGTLSSAEPVALSEHHQLLEATEHALDQAFQAIGQASGGALAEAPRIEGLRSDYATSFAAAVGAVPRQMRSEWIHQVERGHALLPGVHLDRRVLDVMIDRADLIAGSILSQLAEPDVLLRSFDSYVPTSEHP